MKKIWKIAAVLLVLLLLTACGESGKQDATQPPKDPQTLVFWNMDKDLYGTLRHRTKDAETGLYTIRLMGEGKLYEFQTTRSAVVSYMDTEMLLGVTLDENGQIYGIKHVRDFAGSVTVDGRTVSAVEGETVKLGGKGTPSEFVLSKNAKIFDVTGYDVPVGTRCELAEGDFIYAIKDQSGEYSQVYITARTRTHDDSHLCDCCGKTVTWTAWDGKSDTENGGHYYLAADVTLNKAVELTAKEITLCLNGKTFKSRDCAWILSEGAGLNITDHKDYEGNYHGVVKGGGYDAEKPSYEAMEGGTIRVTDETSALRLYGGNLTVTLGEARKVLQGGVILSYGSVDIYGGAVVGGDAEKYAGNIHIRGGVLNIHEGGLVTAGAAEYAGNILVRAGGELNLYDGGVISDGIAKTEGGNVQVNGDAVFNMYGGELKNGGYDTEGKVHTARGGNLMIYGIMNMSGGTMSGGVATGYGGNICTYKSPVLNMLYDEKSTTVPTITGGKAPYAGNVILRGTEPQMNISYGTVTGGVVETNGGGIYVYLGSVNLSGTANISGNGGNDVYVDGGVITADGLTEGACVGVAMKEPGKFLETEVDLRSYFTCTEEYEIVFDDLALELRAKN